MSYREPQIEIIICKHCHILISVCASTVSVVVKWLSNVNIINQFKYPYRTSNVLDIAVTWRSGKYNKLCGRFFGVVVFALLRQGTYGQIRFDLSQPVIAFSVIFLRRNTLSSESLPQNGCQSVPSELSCRVRSWRQPPDQHGAPCQLLLPVHGKACYMIPSVLRC